MAKAEQGNNPAAQQIAGDLYEFTLLESDHYTIYAWEDLLPQRAAPHGGNTACVIPAHIETPAVSVDGSDGSTKEITLSFADVECAQQ